MSFRCSNEKLSTKVQTTSPLQATRLIESAIGIVFLRNQWIELGIVIHFYLAV
jgi:hypothetical protein